MAPGLGHLHTFPAHFLTLFSCSLPSIQMVTLVTLVRHPRMTNSRTFKQVACFKEGTQLTLSCTRMRCRQGFASENKTLLHERFKVRRPSAPWLIESGI